MPPNRERYSVTGTNAVDYVRLAALLERDAIKEVLARYVRGCDRADAQLMRSAYWDDASEHHGEFMGRAYEFIDLAVGIAKSTIVAFQHVLGQSLIELNGMTANAETYFLCFTSARRTGQIDDVPIIGGRYIDRFEQRSGEWKIAHRVTVADWSLQLSSERVSGIEHFLAGQWAPDDASCGPITQHNKAI